MPVRIVALTVTILLSLSAAANSGSTADSESKADTIGVEVYFRQGYSRLQPSFHDNGARIQTFIQRVGNIYRDSTKELTSIDVKAYASPEGPYELNQRLARKRAARVADYLRENLTFLPDSIIKVEAGGINWSGLARCVAASDMKYRQDVLDLIENVPENTRRNGRIVDSRLRQLQKLHGGIPYKHVYRHYFPDLRNSGAYIICRYRPAPAEDEIVELIPVEEELIEIVEPEPECPDTTAVVVPRHEWERHAYIKTNLPAWLCLWTNVAGEIDIAPHFSANLSIYYSGFNYFTRTLKFRTLAVMPELRYWLRAKNEGFFAGAHFGLAYYNMALKKEYRYQDHDGSTPAIGGGISIGYRFVLPRNPRWKFEASAGAGIYRLDYDIFINRTNGLLIDRRKRTFYGLDNVAFSICYTFPVRKKGGAGK